MHAFSLLAGPRPITDVNVFGSGVGPIFFYYVHCTGNETNLANCSYSESGYYCYHRNDAGVICSARPSMPTISLSQATSSQANISASIIGGAMGGVLILVILLLVLVVIIAAVVVQRKKPAVQSLQLEVLAR